MKRIVTIISLLFLVQCLEAENGYRLWLRYVPVDNPSLLNSYRVQLSGLCCRGESPTLNKAVSELQNGLSHLLNRPFPRQENVGSGTLLIGQAENLSSMRDFPGNNKISQTGPEGFLIYSASWQGKPVTIITANSDIGVLYGVFQFLRFIQTGQEIDALNFFSRPKVEFRLLDHWDNLNRYVERGYAGISIWNWHTLPGYIDPRYEDYARANASIGINGSVLTNVNANARVLTAQYLKKAAALANVFRPYGIKVYLTARFSAPMEIGGLKTADPLDPAVRAWWKQKANEIYSYIPDFGGFLVKANSEGQPGPQDYHRTHADGANMLAEAVVPHGGIVMWRAFVYSAYSDDRFKEAYEEFKPLDGKFHDNVLIQVKNGPIDFQPREPFSPLFGNMPHTPLMMEFQLTQEYLGQGTHLVYEAPLFRECLESDTYEKGRGSLVAKIVDGSLDDHSVSGMAAVSNIGNTINWTFHPFAQANWYAFGRLAWDYTLTSGQIAEEWIRQTLSNNPVVVRQCKAIMLMSREACVNYMTPLGLHHIMNNGHHYGPAPWSNSLRRADWNPVYFHRADSTGIGFDRTASGSNALAEYAPDVRKRWENLSTCEDKYLLWFHHVPWNFRMKSGRTLWDELCYKYNEGVDSVRSMQKKWKMLQGLIDQERFHKVTMLLQIQENEAVWWRDACLSYFRTFSRMPIPPGLEQPKHSLEYYESLRFPYAPGN